MKAKLIVEGKEFDIDILDLELQKLVTPKKKTGYERVDDEEYYWFVESDSDIYSEADTRYDEDNRLYACANYYSDETVAENNARADKLMRQLRRFAVENRKSKLDWNDESQQKWHIVCDHSETKLVLDVNTLWCRFGTICFDSRETAELAIQTFYDELIWYFTEYKDSL